MACRLLHRISLEDVLTIRYSHNVASANTLPPHEAVMRTGGGDISLRTAAVRRRTIGSATGGGWVANFEGVYWAVTAWAI